MNKVTQEVITKLRGHVVNQSRYVFPCDLYEPIIADALAEVADDITEEETFKFLEGKIIVSDEALLVLAEEITVEEIYDEDGWIDYVAEYLMKYRDDCLPLWTHLADSL